MPLFMVFRAFLDLEGTVDLFEEDYPGHLMWKGHPGHGKLEVRTFLDAFGYTEGGAYHQIYGGAALCAAG